MKSVLISIQPKWCELIASGKKTVEVRKTKPKIGTPFKCYIYCTNNGGTLHIAYDGLHYHKGYIGKNDSSCINGKVIGEFICDRIDDMRDVEQEPTCISIEEWLQYTDGHKEVVWGWHISDLVIYDKPKSLSEFKPYCDKKCVNGRPCKYQEWIEWFGSDCCTQPKTLTSPPQSWCYVEEAQK